MPLFNSKRSRSMSNTRAPPAASSSAHMAAAQAFLKNRQSQSDLSHSAAATALRTMSPTPTPVDQVQTKRMLDRQTSNSSTTNAPRGRSRGALQRRPSSGSMTERTFRSPSPGQPGSQTAPAQGVGRGSAPPVPPLPRTYIDDVPAVPQKSHRRAASMEVLPPRVTSPAFTRPKGRGQSTDRTNPPPVGLAAAAARKSTALPQTNELERSDSREDRNSINFSYPRGSRPNSPPPRSPVLANGAAPTRATVPSGISASEMAQIQHDLSQAATKPTKKKQKVVDRSVAEGSHLQTGTMNSKPTVTPLEPSASTDAPTTPQPTVEKKKKAALTGQSSHFPSHSDSPASDGSSPVQDTPDRDQEKRTSRAAGVLLKQPSVVREDWEGEQEQSGRHVVDTKKQDKADVISSRKPATEANMSRKIEEPSAVASPKSSRNLALPINEGQPVRPVSTSPSRSMRFSDRLASDLTLGKKHEPLGRSISPAKSALKHLSTSSTSPTDRTFSQRRGSSVTPSESSEASAEGGSRRKKSVRVSFEAKPGTSSHATDTSRARSSGTSLIPSSEEDLDETMKPRPALPSFGSVRNKERSSDASPNRGRLAEDRNNTKYSSTRTASSSETSSIADPPTMTTSVSSDHGIGGVLFHESQKSSLVSSKTKINNPLPPEVTSVEGTGYHSDSGSVYSEDGHMSSNRAAAVPATVTNQTKSAKASLAPAAEFENEHRSSLDVPAISVLPATPGVDEQGTDEWGRQIPGGFPASTTSRDRSIHDAVTVMEDSGDHEPTHNYGLAVSEPSSPRASESVLQTVPEESDVESVYSDAAEEISDLEGDGFGSINAIVKSPVVSSPTQPMTSPPDTPLADMNRSNRPVEHARTASWEGTQAHWKDVAARVRDTAPRTQEQPSVADSRPAPTEEPKKRKTQVQAIAVAPPSPTPKARAKTGAQSLSQEPRKTQKQSPSTSGTQPKQSSLAKPQGGFRSSMRTEATNTVPARERPNNRVESPNENRVPLTKRVAPPAAPKPALSRQFSNDSDSDSSFRRARRSQGGADNKYTMKRTMRGASVEPEQSRTATARREVRSLSPVERRPFSGGGAQKPMRASMRGSRGSVDSVPTLRNQPEPKRPSSLFGRSKKAKSPTRPTSVIPSASALKSRIVDSDDEEDRRPTQFRSRFAHDSDDDEPEPLRPVRGIPRNDDERDSTDLDDSSDDEARRTKTTAPKKKLEIKPPPVDEDIASPPLSPTSEKKRGFWGRLRGKKKEEKETSSPVTIAERNGTKDDIEAGKKESNDVSTLGFNSTAERDALVEQTRLKLEAAKAGTSSPRPTSPVGGKLQRRATPQRILSDSWPLPPKITADADDRPNTSDGVTRPEMGDRVPTSDKVSQAGGDAAYGRSGKKKRFPLLRRAFGLTD